jgi:hypothetical protein
MQRSIYIGYDPREADAYAVCRGSLLKHLSESIPVHGLVLAQLQVDGIYTRPTERIAGRLIDVKSRRPDYSGAMSTEFALSRFFVPHLARNGWALFMDCDMLVRKDIAAVFDLCDPDKAVMCVQHDYEPSRREKMDGQIQTPYARKNWSSFMLFNCDHPANAGLTLDLLNNAPGYMLHQFCWLEDRHIGALPQTWNFLVGESVPDDDPAVAHFTNGVPSMKGHEAAQFADEWRAAC